MLQEMNTWPQWVKMDLWFHKNIVTPFSVCDYNHYSHTGEKKKKSSVTIQSWNSKKIVNILFSLSLNLISQAYF